MSVDFVGGCKVCPHHEGLTKEITEIKGRQKGVVTILSDRIKSIKTMIIWVVGVFSTCGVFLFFILNSFADTDKEVKGKIEKHEEVVGAKVDDAIDSVNCLRGEVKDYLYRMESKVAKVNVVNKVITRYLEHIMKHSDIPVPVVLPEEET